VFLVLKYNIWQPCARPLSSTVLPGMRLIERCSSCLCAGAVASDPLGSKLSIILHRPLVWSPPCRGASAEGGFVFGPKKIGPWGSGDGLLFLEAGGPGDPAFRPRPVLARALMALLGIKNSAMSGHCFCREQLRQLSSERH
jgi:hypothetical protein